MNVDRELCRKISERFRKSGHPYFLRKSGAGSVALAKKALEEAANSSEVVLLSQIALKLGYSRTQTLKDSFPDLCAAVLLKANRAKSAYRRRNRQGLEEALCEEPARSFKKVADRLGVSHCSSQQSEPELAHKITARFQENQKIAALN